MQKLISELSRLYIHAGALPQEIVAQRLLGQASAPVSLTAANGMTRALAIAFRKVADAGEARHWHLLCEVANALQVELGLPAPAVSISGVDGYGLWLSFAEPVPTAQVQNFLDLLRNAYFPEMAIDADAASAPVELPPCLNQGTGKYAAFIHPDLGASFADEAGLEMAPPFAGQAALLDGLRSISPAQFEHAVQTLQQSQGLATAPSQPAPQRVSSAPGLLLKDATLDDIISHLHAKNIEPTFRHLLPRSFS
jgi:hypothetical protein